MAADSKSADQIPILAPYKFLIREIVPVTRLGPQEIAPITKLLTHQIVLVIHGES